MSCGILYCNRYNSLKDPTNSATEQSKSKQSKLVNKPTSAPSYAASIVLLSLSAR